MNLMQLPDEQNSKRQVSDENQEKMEKIFLEKPDWKKKEKHHQTVFTNGQARWDVEGVSDNKILILKLMPRPKKMKGNGRGNRL